MKRFGRNTARLLPVVLCLCVLMISRLGELSIRFSGDAVHFGKVETAFHFCGVQLRDEYFVICIHDSSGCRNSLHRAPSDYMPVTQTRFGPEVRWFWNQDRRW